MGGGPKGRHPQRKHTYLIYTAVPNPIGTAVLLLYPVGAAALPLQLIGAAVLPLHPVRAAALPLQLIGAAALPFGTQSDVHSYCASYRLLNTCPQRQKL